MLVSGGVGVIVMILFLFFVGSLYKREEIRAPMRRLVSIWQTSP
jgi:hypothetical protein